ncbi:hypothetical protein E2C01_018267 [Portunus trituberculatus]|uniref:Uncharacterized protein n=1 Tax=Portunus trituberculatus TaxID=210409 RepID=A0A5B7DVZ6_PORTR|nr:hypothetical protein [Portunus trituberculatus]
MNSVDCSAHTSLLHSPLVFNTTELQTKPQHTSRDRADTPITSKKGALYRAKGHIKRQMLLCTSEREMLKFVESALCA